MFRRRTGAGLLSVLLGSLVVSVASTRPAAAGPPAVLFGYVPLPADQFQAALESIHSNADSTLDFTVGISNAGSGAVMYYDHWEDGLEADIANPVLATTQVWGDADPANGDASDVCGSCAGDLLTPGDVFVLRDSITTPRDATEIRYDGGDKVASTRGFSLNSGGFTTPLGSVLADQVAAYDVSRYGTEFLAPVGEDTPFPAGTSDAFAYTGAMVMAAGDGTTVEVDVDADGSFDVSEEIDEGETTFVDGGLLVGARVVSSQPVQAHLITGDPTATYEDRSFEWFPLDLLSNDYVNPVGSSLANHETIVYLHNPNPTDITVTPTCPSCSDSLAVPANGGLSFTNPLGEGVRFVSDGGEIFQAVGAMDAQSGASDGMGGLADQSSTYDWGYTLVPTGVLTTQVVLAWAPGNSDAMPTDDDDDPVWVSALAATTLRVDRDGDPDTGALPADCFGQHDLEIPVGAFESTRITDPNDNDMTGARIYTCDDTAITGAWGEDPANAPPGSPGLDAGYTLVPVSANVVNKTAALFDDANGDGRFGPGDTVEYEVAIADAGSLALTNVVVEDALAAGISYIPGTAVHDDGTTQTPIPDDQVPPATTAFPFDDVGAAIPDVAPGQTVFVRFRVEIDPSFPPPATLGNTVVVTSDEADGFDQIVTTLAESDLELTKTETADPQVVGDTAVFEVSLVNQGPDDAAGVEVTDQLPAGTTLVLATPSQGTYTAATGLWDVGSLAPGATATLQLTATVDTTTVENIAEVTASGSVDPDSTPGNADPTEDDMASVSVSTTGGSLGDLVWYDVDGDGTQEAGEPGIAGAELLVTWAGPNDSFGDGDDATFPATTDTDGTWSVAELPSGSFRVAVDPDTLPPGLDAPTFDLDGIASPHETDVALAGGEARDDVDFGYTGAGAVGDTVFHDSDDSGTPDAGEGLAGVDVVVLWSGPNGTLDDGDDVSVTATTDAAGSWTVAVPGGPLRITVDTATLPAGVENTVDPDGGNDDTAELTLAAGDSDLEQDFGYRGVAGIGDLVFHDVDGDGAAGAGEAGLPGVEVTVTWAGANATFGDGDDQVFTATTDDDGTYLVEGLPAGEFRVEVDTVTLPSGFTVNTADPDGGGDSSADLTLAAGGGDLAQDFGYQGTGSIGDTVFLDADDDGVAEEGEGIADVTVTVTWAGLNGTLDDDDVGYTATTDADGSWSVTGLPAGDFRVDVLTATLPEDDLINTVDPDGGNDDTAQLTLAAGDADNEQDFGYQAPSDPDLAMTKSHQGQATAGQPLTFDLQVTNNGPEDHPGPVAVTDTLVAGYTYVSSAGTGWSCAAEGQVVTCTRSGELAANSSSVLSITVAVAANATGSLPNTATVSSDLTDPVPANDTDTDDVSIGGTRNVAISKRLVQAAGPGGQPVWEITVTNTGVDITGPIVVTDQLPSGLQFVTAEGDFVCQPAGATITCQATGLAAGRSLVLRVTTLITAAAGTRIVNGASVLAGGDLNAADNASAAELIVGAAQAAPAGALPATGSRSAVPLTDLALALLGAGLALIGAAALAGPRRLAAESPGRAGAGGVSCPVLGDDLLPSRRGRRRGMRRRR